MLDVLHHADDVVHQLVPVHCLDLQLAVAFHAFLLVPPLAAQAVVVTAGDDGDGVHQLVAVGALNLRLDQLVNRLEVAHLRREGLQLLHRLRRALVPPLQLLEFLAEFFDHVLLMMIFFIFLPVFEFL